jgi:hypothetical protein
MKHIKRFVAREWLVFLACLVIGLSATYFGAYYPEQWTGRYKEAELTSKQVDQWLANSTVDFTPLVPIMRRYTVPEFFHDLSRNRSHIDYLWLRVLSPFLGLCFLRSVFWAAKKLRMPLPA